MDKAIDVTKSPTYQRLKTILLKDAVANLPNDVYKQVGVMFVANLIEILKEVETYGYCYIFVDKNKSLDGISQLFYKDVCVNDNRLSIYINGKTVYIENYQNSLIVAGNPDNIELYQFRATKPQQETIIRYEHLINYMFEREAVSSAKVVKTKELLEAVETNDTKKYLQITERLKNIIKPSANKVIALDVDEELQDINSTQSNVAINEIKEKLVNDFDIPYSVLFKGVSSGFNNLDLEDRNRWNYKILHYQSLKIFPIIQRYAEILGLKINLTPEKMENEDKQTQVNITTQKLNDITNALSFDLISQEEAKELTKKLLNLTIN